MFVSILNYFTMILSFFRAISAFFSSTFGTDDVAENIPAVEDLINEAVNE